jgi:hypothetical protein
MDLSSGALFPIKLTADVMQHAVDKVTVSFKASVVPIMYVRAGQLVATLVGMPAAAPRLIVSTIREELLPDLAVLGNP